MQLANQPIDWNVYPATASSRRTRGDRQMFVATLHVKRKPRYYEINVFLALFLISTFDSRPTLVEPLHCFGSYKEFLSYSLIAPSLGADPLPERIAVVTGVNSTLC